MVEPGGDTCIDYWDEEEEEEEDRGAEQGTLMRKWMNQAVTPVLTM